MKENITLSDVTIGYIVFVYKLFESTFDYFLIAYLLVENWYDAILIRGNFRKGPKLKYRPESMDKSISGKMIHIFAGNIEDCKVKGKYIFLKYKGKRLALHYTNDYQLTNTLTGIKEQLIEEQYKDVDARGKVVLDLGSSVGDSAIYFALNGAKSIIALEPYPFTYRTAKRNVQLNGLAKKVLVINEACRSKRGRIIMDPNFQNSDRDSLRHFKKGKIIDVTTLDALVKKYKIDNAVLKIDCEGYEYEIIEGARVDILRKFKTITLEYHYGYRSLEAKLRKAGFKTRHTEPFYMSKVDDKVNLLCGLIFAERLN